MAFTAFVALVAAEIILSVPSVRAALPPRTHYYHQSIAQRLDDLDRLAGDGRRVDVLFIGSSIVRTDVNPRAFDEALGFTAQTSYNAAMDGMWPAGVELYTRHVWLPAARPRVVIQGIRYPELIVDGLAKHDTQIWSGTVEQGWRTASFRNRLVAAATLRLRVLQYRGALTSELRRWARGYPGGWRTTTVRGHEPQQDPAVPVETLPADLPNDGTCQHGRCDRGLETLRRTRDLVHAAGAEYVLLNVPEHGSRWRDADGPARYRQYVDTLRRFAEAEQIPFVDVTDGDPFRFDAPNAFRDRSHMTAAASLRFTGAVARRLLLRAAAARRSDARPW